jgi:regulator of sigma E protease
MNLDSLLAAITAVSGLAFLITGHEAGHWLAARSLGMKTLVFSVGMGGKATSIRLGRFWETEFRLGLLPIGGYVLIPELSDEPTGRMVLEESGFDADTYVEQPAWKKAIVMAAGPVANLLLAYLLYAVLLVQHRHLPPAEAIVTAVSTTGAAVGSVLSGLAIMFHLLPAPPDFPADATAIHSVVGIFQVMQSAAGTSALNFTQILSYLSINLFVFNLVPLPMLDGGQLMLLAIEKAMGRPLSPYLRYVLSMITLLILLSLLTVGVFNDFAHPLPL